jgi:hypothetical protein
MGLDYGKYWPNFRDYDHHGLHPGTHARKQSEEDLSQPLHHRLIAFLHQPFALPLQLSRTKYLAAGLGHPCSPGRSETHTTKCTEHLGPPAIPFPQAKFLESFITRLWCVTVHTTPAMISAPPVRTTMPSTTCKSLSCLQRAIKERRLPPSPALLLPDSGS